MLSGANPLNAEDCPQTCTDLIQTIFAPKMRIQKFLLHKSFIER